MHTHVLSCCCFAPAEPVSGNRQLAEADLLGAQAQRLADAHGQQVVPARHEAGDDSGQALRLQLRHGERHADTCGAAGALRVLS